MNKNWPRHKLKINNCNKKQIKKLDFQKLDIFMRKQNWSNIFFRDKDFLQHKHQPNA